MGSYADDGVGERAAGRSVVVVGDAGEVVDRRVAVGEVAGLANGLSERHVTADTFGIALRQVQRDQIRDVDAETARLTSAAGIPPSPEVGDGERGRSEDARRPVVFDFERTTSAARWRRAPGSDSEERHGDESAEEDQEREGDGGGELRALHT